MAIKGAAHYSLVSIMYLTTFFQYHNGMDTVSVVSSYVTMLVPSSRIGLGITPLFAVPFGEL